MGQAGWLAGGGILFREDNDLSGDGETDFVVDTSVQDPVIGSNGGGVMVAPGVADDLAVIQQALRELPSQEWTTMIEQGGIYFRALREQDYLLNTDGTLRQLNGE